LQQLHRNFEHAEACVAAFVSGCGSAAEVVARAAVESSVNIIYILGGDRTARLFAYFNHYFEGVDRQVKQWQTAVSHLSSEEADAHRVAIQQRKSTNDELRRRI